jgi:hypothetical protein
VSGKPKPKLGPHANAAPSRTRLPAPPPSRAGLARPSCCCCCCAAAAAALAGHHLRPGPSPPARWLLSHCRFHTRTQHHDTRFGRDVHGWGRSNGRTGIIGRRSGVWVACLACLGAWDTAGGAGAPPRAFGGGAGAGAPLSTSRREATEPLCPPAPLSFLAFCLGGAGRPACWVGATSVSTPPTP